MSRLIGRVKKRTFSGVVCEQEVYTVASKKQSKDSSTPRLRFNSDEERAAHRAGISRRRHAQLVNANFNPTSLYSTFTFDKENEVHDYEECKLLLRRFVNRLLYKYPTAVIFYYMGRGKHTNRYHIHMLTNGIPEHFLASKWWYGSVVRIERMRAHNYYDGIDHGADYSALADYLFEHWEPEQGPHRYHHNRNAKQPEEEEYTECKRVYSEEHPPKAPKGYKLVETRMTRYGYQYFKYVIDTGTESRWKRRKE